MGRAVRRGVTIVHLFIGQEKTIRETLWRYLNDHRRALRLVCRALNHASTRHVGQLFRELYVRAPVPDKDLDVIRVVGPLCHHLTVTIGRRSVEHQNFEASPRSSSRSASSMRCRQQISLTRHRWIRLFSSFHQLRTLTLRFHGSNGLSSRTKISETLITLRVAVETNRLPELRTLSLSSFHAMEIVYLCWAGFGAFGPRLKASYLWTQLETLDLRISSPFASRGRNDGEGDAVTAKKILYNYLKSFSKTLGVLRVVWLDFEGPSPLTLHHEHGLKDRTPIQWVGLEELWIGNVSFPSQTARIAQDLAPSLRSLKVLRSTHRESGLANPRDSSAWIDVDVNGESLEPKRRHSRASSVCSQRSDCSVDAIEDISLSSRSILVYKDF